MKHRWGEQSSIENNWINSKYGEQHHQKLTTNHTSRLAPHLLWVNWQWYAISHEFIHLKSEWLQFAFRTWIVCTYITYSSQIWLQFEFSIWIICTYYITYYWTRKLFYTSMIPNFNSKWKCKFWVMLCCYKFSKCQIGNCTTQWGNR